MKKFDAKSIFLGIVIGILGVSSISLAADDSHFEKVESAFFNNSKVYFNQQEITMTHPLIEVYDTNDSNAQLYMSLEDILDYMHFDVEWHQENNSIILTMQHSADQNTATNSGLSDVTFTKLETDAIELITKTGNWNYIEPCLNELSDDAIKKIVSIYNSKHQNLLEHKNANDYIHD